MARLEPSPEPGSSGTTLSRRNLWLHNNSYRPQLRIQSCLDSAHQEFCAWIESAIQEPEAVAWNHALWYSHQGPTDQDEAESITPTVSGDTAKERERLGVYLSLTPERKAALCGCEFSRTAVTRLAGFVIPSVASPRAPSSWRKRLREVEQDLFALRSRVDIVEEHTGTVVGERSKDCLVFRLNRLEASLGLAPLGS